MSLPAMSLEDRFCISRNGGTGEDECVHLKDSMSLIMLGLGLFAFGCFSPVHKWKF